MNVGCNKLALGAFLLLGLSTGAAVATPITETYNISGTFEDPYHTTLPGGTFSGDFTVSGTLTGSDITNYTITAADIAVTSFGPDLGGHTFAGLTYTLSDSSVVGAGAFDYFQLNMKSPNSGDDLRVYFTNAGLTTTGATLALANSYETQISAGNRGFLSGTVSAVPEPSSVALMGAGLILLAGAFTSRRFRLAASRPVRRS